ncbi:hypothetical protein M9H77_20910 [Catharanthus roseus]|uniref:Uncharacterized protein n=1 Tax=Catharanthus roseus TaxID=4058 RepID=A0ACC0AKU0_CATRO|nr:hypothetical protein M9H77_20910 [Catharanthus roseus]
MNQWRTDLEEFNDVINHFESISVDFMLLECLEDEFVLFLYFCLLLKHQLKIRWLEVLFNPKKMHKKLYNDHAFRLGFSSNKGKGEKVYTKVDFHTGCKAIIRFRLNDEGGWTVNKHDKRVTKNSVGYLQELKDCGVSIATGLRVLKKDVGGSPFVRFMSVDMYNILRSKNLDGGMRIHL